jgi:hypothetical protein
MLQKIKIKIIIKRSEKEKKLFLKMTTRTEMAMTSTDLYGINGD